MNYVTKLGLDKLKEELEILERVERPKISNQIAEARDKGDLSENAEYDAAKEAQGLLEMRIAKLKETISNSKIIDHSKLDNSKVSILSTVRMINLVNNQHIKYTLVPDNETDLKSGKISINTPISKGLLGKEEGEEVSIILPNGSELKLKILEITIEN